MDSQRQHIREAHREHLRSIGDKLLASGALLDDNCITVIGGISLIDEAKVIIEDWRNHYNMVRPHASLG